MRRRTFARYVSPRPRPHWLDVVTTLRHFALVTYTMDPDALSGMLPPRLSPLTIELDAGSLALVSVVSFINTRFRSAKFPSPALHMAQINYRAYVVDRATGEHGIWFIETLVDSWAFLVPRFVWHMPWRKAPIRFDYEQKDRGHGMYYGTYAVTAASDDAPTDFVLAETPDAALELPGFPDVETGLVCLTHAFNGFYRRRDGKIAVNRVWHERIRVQPAAVVRASFPYLERFQFVSTKAQVKPYSVLIAPEIEFVSHLPPQLVDGN